MDNSQNTTKRLPAKIEETVLENGIWDKVTVLIPNSSYILNEVKYENNTLSIVFIYTDNSTSESANFAFMLSAFGINPNAVNAEDTFVVIGKSYDSQTDENQQNVMMTTGKKLADFKCPPKCTLSNNQN